MAPLCKWYLYTIIKKQALTYFHNLLNSIDPHIKFTFQQEQDNDRTGIFRRLRLVTRNNGSLIINVYRKSTRTDKYLDYNFNHDKQHKVSTAQTFLHRATTLPNTVEGKQQEHKYVTDALLLKAYPRKFLHEVEKKQARIRRCPSLHQRLQQTLSRSRRFCEV